MTNCISESDLNSLLESGEFSQFKNLIQNNPGALSKVQTMINHRIQERIEIDRRRKGNIQVIQIFF